MDRVASVEEWKAARLELLAAEKAHSRASRALAAKRAAMPWKKLEANYELEGAAGVVPITALFTGGNNARSVLG